MALTQAERSKLSRERKHARILRIKTALEQAQKALEELRLENSRVVSGKRINEHQPKA